MSDDPIIAEVLACDHREIEAVRQGDRATFLSMLSADVVVNNPGNTVIGRDGVMGAFDAGVISYNSFERSLEYAGRLGDAVILMGGEAVTPKSGPGAGKIVRRRFTDIWRREDGGWKLAARQATIHAVE